MIHRFSLALVGVAVLITVITLSLVSANTTYTIDFEGLGEGTIVSILSCDSGINCPSGDPGGSITVRAHNPEIDSGNTNTAMTFNSDCVAFVDCTGGDDDLSFPGHGLTLINSADLDQSDPDDQDNTGSFMEFDFTAFAPDGVTVHSIDVGDIEEREIGALVEGNDGPCTGLESGLNDIPISITGDNVIETVNFELSGVHCLLVHLNGSGTIDNIEFSTVDPSVLAIDIEKSTNGADADGANDPDVPQVAAGDQVTWTYTVTNDGDAPLESVLVVDDNGTPADSSDDFTPTLVSGDNNGDSLLDLDETWMYQASGQAEDLANATADLNLVDGCNPGGTPDRPAFENLAVVTADGGATDSDPSHYCNSAEPAIPAIVIEKSTNGADADGANDPDVPHIAAGDEITWTYTVANTGSLPLELVLVTDDNGTPADSSDDFTPTLVSGDDNGDNILDLDETWTYQASGQAADLANAPSELNLVDGCNPGGTPDRPAFENLAVVTADGGATDSDPSHYCNPTGPAVPEISIEKATNGEDADDPTGPVVSVGSTVDFTYEVTNSGDVDLTNVTVRDDLISVPATGSASATVDFEGLEEGTIVTELSCGAGISCPGGDISGSVLVRAHNPAIDSGNTNTAMIFNADCVAFVDCSGGDDDLSFPGHGNGMINSEDLDQSDPDDQDNFGSFMEFDFSGFGPGEVTAHSIDAGDIEEREIGAFVQGSDAPCTGEESGTQDIMIPLTGDNVIETVSFELAGVHCFLVHLNGSGLVDNIEITAATPADPQEVEVTCPQDTLAVGESMTCTGSTTATPGQYSNLGTACGDGAGETVCDDDPSNHFGDSPDPGPETEPAIDIEKWTRIAGTLSEGDLCDTFEKPKQLTMLYTGDNVLHHSQDHGKVNVSGDAGFAGLVHIIASEKSDGTGKLFFDGLVNLEESFVIDATLAGDDKLKSKTFVSIADQDHNPLQSIEFHTSCSQPLELGDQFGAIQLLHLSDKHGDSGTFDGSTDEQPDFGVDADSPAGPEGKVGDEVTWSYFVSNTGNAPLANITVVDDNGTPGDSSDDFSPTLVGGDENGDNLLDLDEVWLYQAIATVESGQYANLGEVSGVDAGGTTVTDQDPSHYHGACPAYDGKGRGHQKSDDNCGEDSETDGKDISDHKEKKDENKKGKDKHKDRDKKEKKEKKEKKDKDD